MSEETKKPAKHICLTNRRPLGISSDPESDIIEALADRDVMTMVRGLSKQDITTPFTNGAFGLDEQGVTAAVKKMKTAGLICARRVDDHHVYYLNRSRIMFLADSLKAIAEEKSDE